LAVIPIVLSWFLAPVVVDVIELASFDVGPGLAVVDGADGFIDAIGNPPDEQPVARMVAPARSVRSIARRALVERVTVIYSQGIRPRSLRQTKDAQLRIDPMVPVVRID
jgi:hypothetical protein